MADLPQGYIFKPIPQSVQESLTVASNDRIKTITKSAVQAYIASFMDRTGSNRKLTENITKQGLQYVTDKSFVQDDDPTLRHTQLVRFFNEIRERLPSILIVDAGMEFVPQTMGLVDSGRILNNKWQGQFPIYRQIPIRIVVATRDEESTDLLQSLITLMFGELRNLAGGSRITGNTHVGESWVVTLPLHFEAESVEMDAITDDPKDKVWHSSISITATFEDRIIIEQSMDTIQDPAEVAVDQSVNLTPAIDFPDEIYINQQTKLYVNYIQQHHKIVIDNSNIATINQQTMFVTPRRLGSFKIQVVDTQQKSSEPQLITPKVVAEKEVEVIL